jgi:hypothetical protein
MIQKEESAQEEGSVMGTSISNEWMWSSPWKLKVLPKVRAFWWRVIQGILSDATTLKHRHVKELGRCDIFLSAGDDLRHALITFSHACNFFE